MPNRQYESFHKVSQIQRHIWEERDHIIRIIVIDKESNVCLYLLLSRTRFRLPEKKLENIQDPIPYKDKRERYVVEVSQEF